MRASDGIRSWATNQLGDMGDNLTAWATANWAIHFGQLGDNIGRVIKDKCMAKYLKS